MMHRKEEPLVYADPVCALKTRHGTDIYKYVVVAQAASGRPLLAWPSNLKSSYKRRFS